MALLDTAHTMYSPAGITGQYLIQPTSYSQQRFNYYRDYELQLQQVQQAHRLHSPEHYSAELHSRLQGVKEEHSPHHSYHAAFKPYSPGQENLPGQANVPSKVDTAPDLGQTCITRLS